MGNKNRAVRGRDDNHLLLQAEEGWIFYFIRLSLWSACFLPVVFFVCFLLFCILLLFLYLICFLINFHKVVTSHSGSDLYITTARAAHKHQFKTTVCFTAVFEGTETVIYS